MPSKVRIGIIGCGGIGAFHAQIMQEVENVQLTAVADVVPERAQKIAEKYGIQWYASTEEMLAKAPIDAVSVCTPSGMHAEHGIMAARAGKHVLSEKPMDVYVEKIDQLISVCKEQGVTLGGIFQNRFPRALQQIKQIIDDGKLGEIVFVNASCLWLRTQEYYDSGDWRGTWAMDAGVLSNQAIHTIDRMVWLTGMQPEVLSAYCPTLMRDIESEDLGLALLKFPNGAGGVIQGTTLANPGINTTVTICGTKGSVVVEDNFVSYFHSDEVPKGEVEVTSAGDAAAAADPSAGWGGAHAANIKEFAAAILENRPPIIGGDEARKAVQLLNDIYRAAKIGPWAEVKA